MHHMYTHSRMDIINNTSRYVTGTLDNNSRWLDNSALDTILIVLFVVYAAFFAHGMSPKAAAFWGHPVTKLVLFLLVIYLFGRNIALGVASLIALLALINSLPQSVEGYSALEPDDHQYFIDRYDRYPNAMDSLNGTVGQQVAPDQCGISRKHLHTNLYSQRGLRQQPLCYDQGQAQEQEQEQNQKQYQEQAPAPSPDQMQAQFQEQNQEEEQNAVRGVESQDSTNYCSANF